MTDERLRELYARAIEERTTGARADCPAPERLLALARREGDEQERLRTLDHVMSCGNCMRELELLRVIENAGARSSGSNVIVPRTTPVSWRRAVPLALAASLVLAVGISLRQRATSVRSDDVERGVSASLVVHGSSDVTIGQADSLALAWRPVPGASRYVVEVLDDAGRAVMTQRSGDTLLVVHDLRALTPGREYRWWVRTDDAGSGQVRSPLGRLRIATP
jgi:hypothetical protein